jgi:hypothetical protein
VNNNGDRNNNEPNKRNDGARPDLLLKRSENVVTGKAAIMFLKNGPVRSEFQVKFVRMPRAKEVFSFLTAVRHVLSCGGSNKNGKPFYETPRLLTQIALIGYRAFLFSKETHGIEAHIYI